MEVNNFNINPLIINKALTYIQNYDSGNREHILNTLMYDNVKRVNDISGNNFDSKVNNLLSMLDNVDITATHISNLTKVINEFSSLSFTSSTQLMLYKTILEVLDA